jgi:hypothetical protein
VDTDNSRVGIGTATPSVDLDLQTTGSGTKVNIQTSGSALNVDLIDASATSRIRHVGTILDIGADFNNLGTSDPRVRFRVGNTAQASITGHGGIAFGSDTAAANTLDDYEEGTWTPGLTNYNGTPTTSGKYTKIGNMVYCVCNITLDGTSDTSEFWINNLPFTAASEPAGGGYPLNGTWTANFASSSGYYIRVQPSNTYIQFRNFDGNGAISYNSMGNSSSGNFQFFYHT